MHRHRGSPLSDGAPGRAPRASSVASRGRLNNVGIHGRARRLNPVASEPDQEYEDIPEPQPRVAPQQRGATDQPQPRLAASPFSDDQMNFLTNALQHAIDSAL